MSIISVLLVAILLLGAGYAIYRWNTPTAIKGASAVTIDPAQPFASFTTRWGCFKRQGDSLALTAENTLNDEERRQGLSNRPPLPTNQGLLFTFPEDGWHSMWMHNMLFPLDFVVLDRYLRVTRTFSDVPPCLATGTCPTFLVGPGPHVLELVAGTIARQLILPDQKFNWYPGKPCPT